MVIPSTSALCSVRTHHYGGAASRECRNAWIKQASRSELKLGSVPTWSNPWWKRRACSSSGNGRPLFCTEVARPVSSRSRIMASNIAVQPVADHDHDHHNVRTRIHYYRYRVVLSVSGFRILHFGFWILDFHKQQTLIEMTSSKYHFRFLIDNANILLSVCHRF